MKHKIFQCICWQPVKDPDIGYTDEYLIVLLKRTKIHSLKYCTKAIFFSVCSISNNMVLSIKLKHKRVTKMF